MVVWPLAIKSAPPEVAELLLKVTFNRLATKKLVTAHEQSEE
jgi:hypothetical protein